MSDPHAEALQRRLGQLESMLRHSMSISCDRCGVALTLGCSMTADLGAHLYATAVALGWILGQVTTVGLGKPARLDMSVRDFCATCAPLLAHGRH